jgi:hypothetical protein
MMEFWGHGGNVAEGATTVSVPLSVWKDELAAAAQGIALVAAAPPGIRAVKACVFRLGALLDRVR